MSKASLGFSMRMLCLCLALLGAACASSDASPATPMVAPVVAPAVAASVSMAVAPAPPAAQEAASDVALTPAHILGAMTEAYKACTSYRDSGVSTTKITKGPILQKPFKTAFMRPGRFRFEFSQQVLFSKQLWVVWTDGTTVRGWSTVGNWSRADDLQSALAEATGVSGGTALMVPTLLLPADGSGALLKQMTDVERIADSDVGAAHCYCLRGRLGESSVTVWIDQQTHLLLRMERLSKSDDLEATEVTTYEPEIDIQIADAELELIPPDK